MALETAAPRMLCTLKRDTSTPAALRTLRTRAAMDFATRGRNGRREPNHRWERCTVDDRRGFTRPIYNSRDLTGQTLGRSTSRETRTGCVKPLEFLALYKRNETWSGWNLTEGRWIATMSDDRITAAAINKDIALS